MSLQAFIDDSSHGDDQSNPVFVLGGFLSGVSRWETFAAEWEAALKEPPSIDYFKMSEAEALRGEFQGWAREARDKKLELLVPIITANVQTRIACSINKVDWVKAVRDIPVPIRTSVVDKPYCMAFQTIVLSVAAHHLIQGIIEPCDFIFDEQGSIGMDALGTWGIVQATMTAMADAGRSNFSSIYRKRADFSER